MGLKKRNGVRRNQFNIELDTIENYFSNRQKKNYKRSITATLRNSKYVYRRLNNHFMYMKAREGCGNIMEHGFISLVTQHDYLVIQLRSGISGLSFTST